MMNWEFLRRVFALRSLNKKNRNFLLNFQVKKQKFLKSKNSLHCMKIELFINSNIFKVQNSKFVLPSSFKVYSTKSSLLSDLLDRAWISVENIFLISNIQKFCKYSKVPLKFSIFDLFKNLLLLLV